MMTMPSKHVEFKIIFVIVQRVPKMEFICESDGSKNFTYQLGSSIRTFVLLLQLLGLGFWELC